MIVKTKKQLSSIYHLIVAILLMIKGFDKIQHHHPSIGWIILILGLLILIYFFISKIKNIHNNLLEIFIHLFESIALLLTSYVYFEEGKTFLPYITLIAATGFLITTILHLIKHQKKDNLE
jgi:hypothetical protein